MSAPPTQDPSTNGNGTPVAPTADATVTAGTSVLSDDGASPNPPADTEAEAETETGVEAVPTAAGAAGVEADNGAMDDETYSKSTMNL
jgi:hypothetical protein